MDNSSKQSKLVAVAQREDGTVSPHAGRALIWQVYVVEDSSHEDGSHKDAQVQPELAWEIYLTESGCLHEWHVRPDGKPHPLHMVDIAIAGSGGDGVRRRLAERHTKLVDTAETDALAAVLDYQAGTLSPGLPHDEADCLDPEHHKARSEAS